MILRAHRTAMQAAASRVLLRLLSAEPSGAAAGSAAFVGEAGVEERDFAALQLEEAAAPTAEAGAAPASSDGASGEARSKGGGKRGKKGREKGRG